MAMMIQLHELDAQTQTLPLSCSHTRALLFETSGSPLLGAGRGFSVHDVLAVIGACQPKFATEEENHSTVVNHEPQHVAVPQCQHCHS